MAVKSLPHIRVIALGGTIASLKTKRGLAPLADVDSLIAHVPSIQNIAQISSCQLMNIDSTNMQPKHWCTLVDELESSWNNADGFVVLHGTDTMAYSAAALSYLVQNPNKPIVFTGSQLPMEHAFSDAPQNLYQAIYTATQVALSGVSVVFGSRVIAGTRAKKQRTLSSNAFASINYPYLARFQGDKFLLSSKLGQSMPPQDSPLFYHQINPRVAVLKLTPGLSPDIIYALENELDALVLEAFGIGGIPGSAAGDADLTQALKHWLDLGKMLVVTTQVPEEGLDLGVYEVGRVLAEDPRTLVGHDMTTEALLAKTMWILGIELANPLDTLDLQIARRQELFNQLINHDRTVEVAYVN